MRLLRLFKQDLAREASVWVNDGVIREDQAIAICARYGIDYRDRTQQSYAYSVLLALAYLFIGLAVITLIGANWDEIPRALRMGGLIAVTAVCQSIAYRHYVSGRENSAIGLFLLGNLLFGASIILIAQIYHLGEYMPDGVLWWALGCFPVVLITRNPWLALQMGVLALIWFFLEVSFGFYPVLFPLFLLAMLFVLLRGASSNLLLLFFLVSAGFWLEYSLSALWHHDGQGFRYTMGEENLVVAAGLFLFLQGFSHWLATRHASAAADYATVISLWALRFGIVILLVFSFETPWRWLLDADWRHQVGMWIALGLLGGAGILFSARAGRWLSSLVLTLFLWGSVAAVVFLGDTTLAAGFQVAGNLCLVVTAIWLIVRGVQDGISHYFFLGVAVLLLTALLRYIDLIGDYIGAAILFLVFAGLLIGAAKFWRSNREADSGSAGNV